MEIVKKNLVSIICGVVAILAVVAVFVWPLNDYYEELKTKAAARAEVARKIKTIEGKPREKPILTLEQATPEPLDRFPSEQVIKAYEKAREKVQTQSENVYKTAVALNEGLLPSGDPKQTKKPIANGLLPEPQSNTIALRFATNYAEALKQLREVVLKAGIPPTEDEIKRRRLALWETLAKDFIWIKGQQEPVNKPQIDQKYNNLVNELPQVMQQEMATNWKMYVNPERVFKIPAKLPTTQAPDPADIWWCHVEYWVYRDVCQAIAEVNQQSNSVLTSPVKNLIALDVPWNFFPNQANQQVGGVAFGGTGGAEQDPSAIPATGGLPDPTIAIPEGASISPTKRLSNNLYDVIWFDLVVDIDATAVAQFLKTLSTNRFISVLEMDMDAVDSQALKLDGYVYGDQPVVQLKLRCEALLLRQWTVRYMPPSIRKMLGIPDPVQNPALPNQQRAGL